MNGNKYTTDETFEERVTYLLDKTMKETGKTQKAIQDEIGLGNSLLSKFKGSANLNAKNNPTAENLIKLADYFDVSIDYLLCRCPEKTNNLDIKDICAYTGLDEEVVNYFHQHLVVDYAVTHEEDEEEAIYNKFDAIKTRRSFNSVICLDILSSTVGVDKRLTTINDRVLLPMAIYFDDKEYIEKMKKYYFDDIKDFIKLWIDENNRDSLNRYTEIDDYNLQLFLNQKKIVKLFENKYSVLEELSNNENFAYSALSLLFSMALRSVDFNEDDYVNNLVKAVKSKVEEEVDSDFKFSFDSELMRLYKEAKKNGIQK